MFADALFLRSVSQEKGSLIKDRWKLKLFKKNSIRWLVVEFLLGWWLHSSRWQTNRRLVYNHIFHAVFRSVRICFPLTLCSPFHYGHLMSRLMQKTRTLSDAMAKLLHRFRTRFSKPQFFINKIVFYCAKHLWSAISAHE